MSQASAGAVQDCATPLNADPLGGAALSPFEYIFVLVSIIIGLGITHLLTGLARLIQDPSKAKVYWVHLIWVFWQFLMMAFIWWFEFGFRMQSGRFRCTSSCCSSRPSPICPA